MLTPDLPSPRVAIDADGVVEGYASLFGVVDQANDMVMPGAFAQTLRRRDIRRIPMLFQHDAAEPIGIWLELREDWRGLYARGRLIPEVVRARELLALLKAGTADGLSIGFRTVRGRIDAKTRIRRLTEVELWEISLVTFPLLAGARVRAVKDARLPSRPQTSLPRARAEREWQTVAGSPNEHSHTRIQEARKHEASRVPQMQRSMQRKRNDALLVRGPGSSLSVMQERNRDPASAAHR